MRACCVADCKTSGEMPGHRIPKDSKRRMEWLQRLQLSKLTEQNENIIDKLRVCYKHFKDSDYSCALRNRRLVDRAIPSIGISTYEDQVKTFQEEQKTIPQLEETISQSQEQENETSNTSTQVERIMIDHEYTLSMQYEESIPILYENVDMVQQELEAQQLVKQQERKEIKAHEPSIQILQENVNMINQTQQQVVNQEERKEIRVYHSRPYLGEITKKKTVSPTAHEQSIQILKDMINQELNQQQVVNQDELKEIKVYFPKPRPYLGEITRKKNLSPTARKFYDDNTKLRKEIKRLKKRIAGLKEDIKSKTIILNARNDKDRTNCCCATKICNYNSKKKKQTKETTGCTTELVAEI